MDSIEQDAPRKSEEQIKAEELATIERRLRDDPESADAWFQMGLACEDEDRQLDAYRKAVQCDRRAQPGFAKRLADPGLSAKEKSALIERADGSLSARAGALGMLYSRGFDREASVELKALYREHPENRAICDEMVLLFAAEGRVLEACAAYAFYDQGVQGAQMTAEHAAWHIAYKAEFQNAMPLAEWAAAQWPDSSSACCCLAFCHIYGGEIAEAVRFAREAVRRQPGDPEAWFYLGHAVELDGDTQTALSILRYSLDLDPNHLDAKRLMAQIKG